MGGDVSAAEELQGVWGLRVWPGPVPPSRKHLRSTWDLMSILLMYFCCHSCPRMQDVT